MINVKIKIPNKIHEKLIVITFHLISNHFPNKIHQKSKVITSNLIPNHFPINKSSVIITPNCFSIDLPVHQKSGVITSHLIPNYFPIDLHQKSGVIATPDHFIIDLHQKSSVITSNLIQITSQTKYIKNQA